MPLVAIGQRRGAGEFDWVRAVGDAPAALDLLRTVWSDVFGEKPEVRFDMAHGSHKAEHIARERLAAVRARIEQGLRADAKQRFEQDEDGDYVLAIRDVHVVVAPRAAPGGPVVLRVFAITNVGVNVTPDLGLFLARLNFGLMFGRFALDAEHQAIWFDETLLGDQFRDEELRYTLQVVAGTADQWDDRLKQNVRRRQAQALLTSNRTEGFQDSLLDGGVHV